MGSWGLGGLAGSVLIGIGALAALAAIVLAVAGSMGGDDAEGAARREAATPIAFAALALIGAGASLRWAGGCYGDCCDWDDERPNATLDPHVH